MEESESGIFSKEFLLKNKIVIGLVCIGVIFVGIGIGQFFSNQSQNQVTFQNVPSDSSVAGVATESASIVLDIEGEVMKPGVYRLPQDSRVQDLVKIAGGFSPSADAEYIAKYINLAQKLTDGTKIYIPKLGQSPQAEAQTVQSQNSSSIGIQTSSLININTASEQDLDSLPGIGTVTAGKIIAGRPYSSPQDLVDRKIVTQKVYDKIKDSISVL